MSPRSPDQPSLPCPLVSPTASASASHTRERERMLRFDEQHDFEAWLRRCPLPSKALAYAVSRTGDDGCLTVECGWRLPVSSMANGSEAPADVQLVQANLPPVKHLAAEPPTAVRAGSGACGEGAGPAAEGAGRSAGGDGTGGGTADSTSDGGGAGCTCADAGTSVGASAEIASLQVRVRAGLGSGSG